MSFTHASSINYTIQEDSTLVEISLDSPATIVLPEDYSNLQGINQEIGDNTYIFSENLKVKFSPNSYITKTGKEFLFVAPKILDEDVEVKVFLPEGHIISNELVFPKDYSVSSNGKNIILEWSSFNNAEILVFFIPATISDSSILEWLILIVLAGLLTRIVYKKRKEKKKSKKKSSKRKSSNNSSKTKNLFGDEKKIIEYLLKTRGKACWTKELVKDLKIPKVRLSRKLRSLEEKKLIKKEKHGNERRINLV